MGQRDNNMADERLRGCNEKRKKKLAILTIIIFI
jgi:hypothetical protein